MVGIQRWETAPDADTGTSGWLVLPEAFQEEKEGDQSEQNSQP